LRGLVAVVSASAVVGMAAAAVCATRVGMRKGGGKQAASEDESLHVV
jgi:hypothetical protein